MQKITSPGHRPAIHTSLRSDYQKTVLPNGIRVVTEEIPYVRSVSCGVWIDVGSRDEHAGNNGISHFIEHMVFKGTERYSTREIAHSLESVGGYLNAFTTKEHTCYYARILDDNLEKAIDVISDLVLHPVFLPKEIEKERSVILEELKNIEDDPDDLIHDYLDLLVYHNHPLSYPIIGTAANIRKFRREDLAGFVRRFYIPERIVVAAAGNLKHADLVEMISRWFPMPRRRGQIPGRGHAPRASRPVRQSFDKPITQAHICMGTQGCSVRSDSRYDLLVLNSILGEGMSSRLFQNIRERYGFAYNIYSFANMLSDTGSFGIYIGTDNSKIETSIGLITKELDKLRKKPVSGNELLRTKAQLKGTMMFGLESMSNRMMRLGSGELYFGEYLPLDLVLRNIEAVDREHVSEAAEQYLQMDRFSTIVFRARKNEQNPES